jgi:hypothetical protein
MLLKGYSGCEIKLISENGNTFVRKKSKDINYNSRLIIQAKKQEDFSSNIFLTPKILRKDYDELGLFYFEMQYIPGLIFRDFIAQIEIKDIRYYSEKFLSLTSNYENTYFDSNKLIIKKIDSIRENINYNSLILSKCLNYLKNFNWQFIKSSFCHGDLTFENIIIFEKKLYLIDFLDSFVDSWLIDFSKLLQDLETNWSYRNQSILDNNTRIRLEIFKIQLIKGLKRLNYGVDYIRTIYSFLLLNLIRIYPYTSDEKTFKWLDNKLNIVFDIINQNKWEKDL